jgi:hypothetical protein
MKIYILTIAWSPRIQDTEYSPHRTEDAAISHLVQRLIEEQKMEPIDMVYSGLSTVAMRHGITFTITQSELEETNAQDK